MLKGLLLLLSLWFASASLGHSIFSKTKVVEDSEKNVSQLITSFGYPVQEFAVTTEDSYDIMIQRIPHGRIRIPAPYHRKPVAFLMTALACSSADFVVNMPDQSLAFILADHGFDVWLGNVRGNFYSKHVRLKRRQRKFWDFSFDEMIRYDLPSQIDTILHETKQNSLLYVGWSQGSLIMFGLLAAQPRYNQKVRLFNAMGPVAFLGHIKSNIKHAVPFVGGFLSRVYQGTLNGAFMERTIVFTNKLAKKVCKSHWQGLTCKSSFKLFNGGYPIEMNMTRFPVYVSNSPAGTSVRNIFHFSQLVKSNRFQRFDWGRRKNKKIYGQAEPPQYDIRKVTAPVALYWSDGDVMSCEEDVKRLESLLPNQVLSYKVPVHGFTHVDFAWSIFAKSHVYKKILEMMTKFSWMEPRVAQHHSLKSQRGHHASLGATHAHAPWSSGSSLEAQHLSTPPKHFVY